MWFKKLILFFLTLLLLLFYKATLVKASIITIDNQGKVILNVLSSEDGFGLEIPQAEYLEVKKIAMDSSDSNTKITLTKDNGEMKLNVFGEQGEKSLNVTNIKEDVVEIEERPEVERLVLGVTEGKFTLSQKGIVAVTDYEIDIDPGLAKLALSAPSGLRYLSILPRQVIETVFRSKIINKINPETNMILTEEGGGDLAYVVDGQRVINVLNVFEYKAPVIAKVSASTGEILEVNQPTWLRIFGFLFT
jgi:hypothetical protein